MDTLSPGRAFDLLWADLRLVVLDIETLTDLPGLPSGVQAEIETAIERVGRTGKPVTLAPQNRLVRRLQHDIAEDAGVLSESTGTEPARAITLRPARGPAAPKRPRRTRESGALRAIQIALVDCRRGRVQPRPWHSLVNPGVPVDARSSEVHGLDDTHLAGAPTFDAIAPAIVGRLTPAPGETLVLVAHNAVFDVGVLRSELTRVGLPLPDLPVLDTAGRLAHSVGVAPTSGSLKALLAAMGIANPRAHDALADATATAEAACGLLRRAAAQGKADIGELLRSLGVRTTATTAAGPPVLSRRTPKPAPAIPVDHALAHWPLGRSATRAAIADWTDLADACASLRCHDLALSPESLARASADPERVIEALSEVVRRRAAAGDGPGAATAIEGLRVAVERLCPMPAPFDLRGRYSLRRKPAIALAHGIERLTAALPRCADDACPSCSLGDPCPRDTFARTIARAVLDAEWKGGLMKEEVLRAWGAGHGVGGYYYHRTDAAQMSQSQKAAGGPPAGPQLADATTALLVTAYPAFGDAPDRVARARELLARAVREGCGDPALWEAWARLLAEGGRAPDLERAIAACDQELDRRPAYTTDPAWASLALTRDQLASRLERIGERTAVKNGATIVVRRHAARNPRTRPLRFAVTGSR